MKKIAILFFSVIIILSIAGQSNTWQWAQTAKQSGANAYAYANCITTDRCGNVYTTGGYSSDSITFGNITLHNPSNNNEQVYLVKYDPSGNVLWAVNGIGNLNQWSEGIATDKNGNVYVTGQFESPALIFGQDTLYQTPNSYQVSPPANDGFVVKFNTAGNAIWAKKFGGTYWDGISQIATDPTGNIYMSGFFRSDSVVFGSVTLHDSSNQYSNTAFIKCDSMGNVIWAKSSAWGWGQGVTPDPMGNVLFDGGFGGYYAIDTIVFGSHTVVGLAPGSFEDFIVKYDSNGNALWAENVGIWGQYAYAGGLSTDAEGNAYITGDFTSDSVTLGTTTLHGNPLGDDYFFIEKYDTGGHVLWARGATTPAYGGALATDTGNNTYVTGDFYTPKIAFGNNTLYNPDSATSGSHIFLTKYNANGNVLSVLALGGDSDDYTNAIALDVGGNAYLAGQFSSDSIGFGANVLNNAGHYSTNPFVAKYNSGKPPLYLNVPQTTICVGDTIEICANAGFASYRWNTGDTGSCIQIPYAGNYEVTAQNALNCPASSANVSITEFPPSPVTVSVSGDTLSCYTAEAYQWYFDGNVIPADTSAVLIANQSGNYQVKITDANGCPYVSNNIPIIAAGISETATNNLIAVFPNPSYTGEWTLVANYTLIGSNIEIYDMDGNAVYKTEINDLDTGLNLPVSGGVYLLRISNGNNWIEKRLVKL